MERSVRTRRVSPHQHDTLQKRVQQLEHENEQLRAFQNLSGDCYFTLGLDGHLLSTCPNWENLFGFPEVHLYDLSFAELVSKDSKFEFKTALINLQDGAESCAFQSTVISKFGETRQVQIKLQNSPTRDLAYGAIKDITEVVDATVDAQNQKTQVAKLSHELERFAYISSHDLQEPLRMIGSFVQLIQRKYEGEIDPSTQKYIRFTVDGVKRMQALLNDLLKFSRIGRKRTAVTDTNCNDILQVVRTKFGSQLQELNGKVVASHLPTIHAEKALITQLLQSLIGNSLKFTDSQQPEIKINATRSGDNWLFSFTDNGPGIGEEFSEKVFEVFQKLHVRDTFPGTGMGLAFAKKIVELHGGRIWINTKYKGGTMVQFTLPA